MHASTYGFNDLYVLKSSLKSHVLIHVCPRKFPCAIRGNNLRKMRQGSTLGTAPNFCLLKAFTCVACKGTGPIVPFKSCLAGICMNILSRNVFVGTATVLYITQGTGHLLFYSAASAHTASPSEQAGTGVGSDLDFLGLPLSSSLTWGPFRGLCALVCLLKNR